MIISETCRGSVHARLKKRMHEKSRSVCLEQGENLYEKDAAECSSSWS